MAKTYTLISTYPSSSDPNKVYSVKEDELGQLSCDCRGWTTKKPGKPRTCRHVQDVERQRAQGTAPAPTTPEPAAPPVITREPVKGGSLKEIFQILDKKGL